MLEADRRIALVALRNRAAGLADAIVRTDQARRALAVAFKACADSGSSQEDIDLQVRLVCRERPERQTALEHAGLLEPVE